MFDFKLSDAEMAELKTLNATNMRVVNPPHARVGCARCGPRSPRRFALWRRRRWRKG